MYSFEGDFRRKPQQNLGGASASHKTNRDALLHKAQQERQKREELRRRLNSTIKIQAYVRSFLARTRCKRSQRFDFDNIFHHSNLEDVQILNLLLRKILFFYDQKKDISRLISISQQVLKQWMRVLQSGGSLIQIRRLLAMHLRLFNRPELQSHMSLAIPLRMLEMFTSYNTAAMAMDRELALNNTSSTLLYLVKQGFYDELRKFLDYKTPPLYGVSPHPPTPICSSLLDLIQRPLDMINLINNPQFCETVLCEFTSSFLCPQYSDPVQLFILPALICDRSRIFPFLPLVKCLERKSTFESGKVTNTSWLLHAVLLLEPRGFAQVEHIDTGSGASIISPHVLEYLRLIARLTDNVCNKSIKYEYEDALSSQQSALDNDSDSDDEQSPSCVRETTALAECIEMLNDHDHCVMLMCTNAHQRDWSGEFLESVSKICHNLLLSHRMALHKYRLLYTLAFKPVFLRSLWHWMSTLSHLSSYGGSTRFLLVALSRGDGSEAVERILAPLAVFCALFSLLIGTLHDAEFCKEQGSDEEATGSVTPGAIQAFTFSELGPLCLTLRQVCLGLVELAFPESRPTVRDDYKNAVLNQSPTKQTTDVQNQTAVWAHLFKVSVHLLRQLYSRDTRLHFCSAGDWLAPGTAAELGGAGVAPGVARRPFRFGRRAAYAVARAEISKQPPLTTKEVRTMTILREIPFVVPFSSRVVVFHNLIMRDKAEHQGDLASFLQGPSIQITVRRSHLYEDAFDKLSPANEPDLRLKMRIQLINAAGADEAGVDGGGVFREFLSELLRSAFDPNRGLFRMTRDHMLYPNPAVHLLYDDFPRHYYFVGRMLGKALYENLLVELPLAEFFLGKLSSVREAAVQQLASLDPALYRGLLMLKAHRRQDVPELGLDFTVVSDELGEQRIEELKPDGSNIPVTAENRIEYIHLVADYKLNRQIRTQCTAFKRGLTSVVSTDWLRMFSCRELQVLISGAEIPVDIQDLRHHTNYSGGYGPDHPAMLTFWKVVENFTDVQKRQLLKFVTSCSRPPLLGFKELDPPFCIQHAGTSDRLPSASTCMNLLKLPEFETEEMLKEKLLYAIQAGAGFELS